MYTPKFNRVTDRAVLLEAMRNYSFAIIFGPLTGFDAAHGPVATHLPLMVKDEGESGVLEGHFAAANPHWKTLAGKEALVVFPGPHSYVSPAFYTDPLSVPTWNYITVHAYGTLQLIEAESDKNRLVEELILANEAAYLHQWRAMPDGFKRTMLTGIVGFRIPISKIEGKFKISQNREKAERSNVQAAHAGGSDDQRELARWMERLAQI